MAVTLRSLPTTQISFFAGRKYRGRSWGRDSGQWVAVGRLKAGFNIAQAETELQSITSHLAAQNPATRKLSVHLASLDSETTSQVRPALLLMLGISIVLLLIACTNIMNLLFSRAVARGREMAVRKAVGATTTSARPADAYRKRVPNIFRWDHWYWPGAHRTGTTARTFSVPPSRLRKGWN